MNFNRLAKATLQVAQSRRRAPDISPEDIEKVSDFESTFNDILIPRRYCSKLKEEDHHLSDGADH